MTEEKEGHDTNGFCDVIGFEEEHHEILGCHFLNRPGVNMSGSRCRCMSIVMLLAPLHASS